TAIPSTTVTTAKKGHDTIQSARPRRRRSGRDSSGGANQAKIDCRVNAAPAERSRCDLGRRSGCLSRACKVERGVTSSRPNSIVRCACRRSSAVYSGGSAGCKYFQRVVGPRPSQARATPQALQVLGKRLRTPRPTQTAPRRSPSRASHWFLKTERLVRKRDSNPYALASASPSSLKQ